MQSIRKRSEEGHIKAHPAACCLPSDHGKWTLESHGKSLANRQAKISFQLNRQGRISFHLSLPRNILLPHHIPKNIPHPRHSLRNTPHPPHNLRKIILHPLHSPARTSLHPLLFISKNLPQQHSLARILLTTPLLSPCHADRAASLPPHPPL